MLLSALKKNCFQQANWSQICHLNEFVGVLQPHWYVGQSIISFNDIRTATKVNNITLKLHYSIAKWSHIYRVLEATAKVNWHLFVTECFFGMH